MHAQTVHVHAAQVHAEHVHVMHDHVMRAHPINCMLYIRINNDKPTVAIGPKPFISAISSLLNQTNGC
jgi:hypothetical protein